VKVQLRKYLPLVGIVLFAVAIYVLDRQLREYHYHDVVRYLTELPTYQILLAILFTIGSYLALTGYDTLAVRYIQQPMPYRQIAFTSFIGYAFSNNIGLTMLTGASLRYRLYSAWGLSALDITRVVAFNGLTLWLGFFAAGGLTFTFENLLVPPALHLPLATLRPIGIVFLALVLGYMAATIIRREPFKFWNMEISLPRPSIAVAQILIATIDWMLVSSVLYILLPSDNVLTYPLFLGLFMLAQIAGILSQIPGGLGVFETIMLVMLSPMITPDKILASLLAFRGIYYLLPLAVAAVSLGSYELIRARQRVARVGKVVGQWIPALLPHLLAVTTFLSGVVLLISGATPAVEWRLSWLDRIMPLPIVEISHFLGSIAGVGLLFLAWGLQHRINVAWAASAALLVTGVIVSLVKGLDYEEAIFLSLILLALWPCRRFFYRRAAVIDAFFSPGWLVAITVAVGASIWIGIFAYRHVEFSNDLWWKFTIEGDAPRFLRATVGVVTVGLILATTKLLKPSQPDPGKPGPDELSRVSAIIDECRSSTAHLALSGDKALLFNDRGNTFIMYGIEGRSWVAMGEPVGPEVEWRELIWRFRELCDRHDGWTAFYQVKPSYLYHFLDIGLTAMKLGEEARVPLGQFSLDGPQRKQLRHYHGKAVREGCTFRIAPPAEIPSLLPQLRRISDTWLELKNAREKGFSLGFFDDDYVKRLPAGLVVRNDEIIAFATIWPTTLKEELSIDLMRHLPEAPGSVMDFLFIELMLWGKVEGYQWFNLGMAPFAGMETRSLTPYWNRLGSMIFRHGEHFYNFQGLRQYKQKFDPVWEPKYLMSPGGLAVPRILSNIASLVAGGVKGVISK
jgi:phosphatidylglycerol lysyltransferase